MEDAGWGWAHRYPVSLQGLCAHVLHTSSVSQGVLHKTPVLLPFCRRAVRPADADVRRLPQRVVLLQGKRGYGGGGPTPPCHLQVAHCCHRGQQRMGLLPPCRTDNSTAQPTCFGVDPAVWCAALQLPCMLFNTTARTETACRTAR